MSTRIFTALAAFALLDPLPKITVVGSYDTTAKSVVDALNRECPQTLTAAESTGGNYILRASMRSSTLEKEGHVVFTSSGIRPKTIARQVCDFLGRGN